jgi:hypothetical protein
MVCSIYGHHYVRPAGCRRRSGSVTLLQSFSQIVLSGKTSQQRRFGLIVILVLAGAGTALSVWNAVHRGEPYFHIISGTTAFGAAVVLILLIASYVEARITLTLAQYLSVLILLLICAAALGRWLGETVRETADFTQDVYVKDQTLNDVKLIIVMSRHTVLLKENILYTVPTGDITKFQTVDKNAKPKVIP